jgi:hypothetical protein
MRIIVGHRRGRRSSAKRRRARARIRGAVSLAVLLTVVVVAVPWLACVGGPPSDANDICSIFDEKRSWHRASVRAAERWGVPESVQLAIIHQESSFRATARPPRRKILWLLPGPRLSSAYGYGQVVDSTWMRYVQSTGNRRASRDDFDDVADFIGWYADRIHRRTGIAKHDAGTLYMAYHEGPGGFQRGTYAQKPWLQRAARRVDRRAGSYASQYADCRERLSRRRFLGIF